jgi:small subunit ribosomal protein S6
VLASNGVIRGLKNWGQFDLPRPKTKHQTQHRQGHYFVMQFDCSVQAQESMRKFLSLDPRMLRHSVVKIGDKLGGINGAIEEVDGHMPWNENKVESVFLNPKVVGGR